MHTFGVINQVHERSIPYMTHEEMYEKYSSINELETSNHTSRMQLATMTKEQALAFCEKYEQINEDMHLSYSRFTIWYTSTCN